MVIGEGMGQGTPGSLKGLQLDGPGGDWNSFVFFDVPDDNSWAIQQRPSPAN
ncbi:hypothetical protein ACFVZD_43275 [Streptomyces sp. NPDC058287]|uniref:hypothetical protein n=1 Tax=unclassified Streptomyces TaxID=2593676 RepID=UPI0036EEBF2E